MNNNLKITDSHFFDTSNESLLNILAHLKLFWNLLQYFKFKFFPDYRISRIFKNLNFLIFKNSKKFPGDQNILENFLWIELFQINNKKSNNFEKIGYNFLKMYWKHVFCIKLCALNVLEKVINLLLFICLF